MMHGNYEIVPYHHDYMDQVVKVIKALWGYDREHRISRLKWKHYDNPYSDFPHGIVALHKGEVVGFRAYSSMKWKVNGKKFKTLTAGDTIVNEKHRMKGLSVAMGWAANEYLDYKLLLNFTAGTTSMPGYMKLGFEKLLEKKYWIRGPSEEDKKLEGDFDNVSFLETPDLKKICSFISRENVSDKILPVRSKKYFRWKMANPMHNYKFFSYKKNGKETGYVMFSTQPKSQNGYIVDYTIEDVESLDNILRYVIKKKPFNFTMVFNYGVCDKLSQVLKGLEFKKSNMNWHLLVRPVKRDFVKEDWIIEGLNTRDIENWNMRAICSDDA